MASKKKKKNKQIKPQEERIVKICPICEKPHKKKTQCCKECNVQLRELKDIVEPKSVYSKVSINKVMNVKNKFNPVDVFKLIKDNPTIWYKVDKRDKRLEDKRNIRAYQRSEDYRKQNYKKWENEIPMYIYKFMEKYPSKKFITLSGNKLNPNIHYLCLKCNEEQVQTYQSLIENKGHNCSSTKSSGEVMVEEYLKSFTKIKTQYDTLKCINPITGRQLPYDIEIVGKNILVEIQGEQHLKYIEYFHGTIENFYYQQRKDDYKKRFAESKGYRIIYIYYNDLRNGNYKNKLDFK